MYPPFCVLHTFCHDTIASYIGSRPMVFSYNHMPHLERVLHGPMSITHNRSVYLLCFVCSFWEGGCAHPAAQHSAAQHIPCHVRLTCVLMKVLPEMQLESIK